MLPSEKRKRAEELKKTHKRHLLAALILGIIWILCYLYANSVHGGIDAIGLAFVAGTLYVLATGAFILNLILYAFNIFICYSPKKGKIFLSWVLLAVYTAALLYTVYSAFSFSYGKFFQYLAEGEFFSILHVVFLVILIVMILIRRSKLRRYKAMR